MTDATAKSKTRDRTTRRWFIDENNQPTDRAHIGAIGFGIEFVETGEVLEAKLSDFAEGVRNAAALFGFVTSITNAAGGAEKTGSDRVEAARSRFDALLEGDWSAAREVGVRTADAVEALVRIKKAAGKTIDREETRRKLLSGEISLADLQANKRFVATVAAIQAERKQERAAKLAAEAGDADADALDDLLG
jgi:hypothetical protein